MFYSEKVVFVGNTAIKWIQSSVSFRIRSHFRNCVSEQYARVKRDISVALHRFSKYFEDLCRAIEEDFSVLK